MSQSFKSIYFADIPVSEHGKKAVTVAFGGRDASLFDAIRALSSHEIRQLLGHPNWHALRNAAAESGLSVNMYCLRILRENLKDNAQAGPLLPGMGVEAIIPFDHIQATYRGGASEPMHNWYPYAQAYSPDFVRNVIQEFAPTAERILDPFAGLGTTPLTIAGMGRDAIWCELNPVMQFIADTKISVSLIDPTARTALSQTLQQLAEEFPSRIANSAPDEALPLSYERTFGTSKFFDETAFAATLRSRSLIDALACTSPEAARLLTIAVVAVLVPASNLIRRGDVRFKTPVEMERHHVDFVEAVQAKLTGMADDLLSLTTLARKPIFACEDARSLGKLPPLAADALVTSPPYLNGTNYFRNTKVELWFLRCLLDGSDLTSFRRQAVTAGINDVTIAKAVPGDLPDAIGHVVDQIAQSAYDSRIPLMVQTYFADMKSILSAARQHLVPDAPICIDIGDSAYGGVHVPTQKLITEVLEHDGYGLSREITLRRRLSRSKFPLTQSLLVYRRSRSIVYSVSKTAKRGDFRWSGSWADFKSSLPHQSGDFSKRNWGHPLHSLCSYQGKMKPSLAFHLVSAFVPKGGRLLDPFAGVGTIPFEAALQGMTAFGFEISPAALSICKAKLGRPDRIECTQLIEQLNAAISEKRDYAEDDRATGIHFNGPLSGYFHPETFREILAARNYFLSHKPESTSAALVHSSLLHILHGNRPYALSRRSHPITPFAPTGPTEYRALIPRLREKVLRSLDAVLPEVFVTGETRYQDATTWWPRHIDQLDAVITSPPFFDSTRFYLANWMRLWFCGWNANDFRERPLAFVDERQKKDFRVYEPVFRQARERMKPGGVMVLHLGKSRKCDMAEHLADLAKPWFRILDRFAEDVSHCESHGIRDKGTVEEHTYLVLG